MPLFDVVGSLFRHSSVQSITAPSFVNSANVNSGAIRLNAGGGGSAKRKSSRRRSKRRSRSRSRSRRRRRNGRGSSSSPSGGGSKPGSSSPPARAYSPRFGVFTGKDTPYNGSVSAVDRLESKLGREIDIVNWYQSWGSSDGPWVTQVQPNVIHAVSDSGRTPTLTWEPWNPSKGADQPEYRLRRIADGEFDDYITSWADALRDTHTDIYLRPMHEMNGDWYPWGDGIGDNSPQKYIDAWRRMHNIFQQRGATNVKWVWCPCIFQPSDPKSRFEKFYPGDQFVDVLGLDGYNWGKTRPENGGWQSFSEVFGDPYHRLTNLSPHKPIWINEVGSAPEGGSKSNWVSKMWDTVSNWRRLEAIVWFDQHKEEDWRAAPVAKAFATSQ